MKKTLTNLILAAAIAGTTSFSASAMRFETGYAPAEVDMNQITTWVGEGEASAAVILRWNDGKGIDNITLGVRFDPVMTPSASLILYQLYSSADWRFYSHSSDYSDFNGNLCFDLNGDKIRDNEVYTRYDHFSTDLVDGEWVVTSPNDIVEDGDVIFAEFLNDDANPAEWLDYLFYLPAADETGVWLPQPFSFPMADEKATIPLYMNLNGGTLTSATFTPSPSGIGTIALSNLVFARSGQMLASATSSGKTGDVTVKARIRMTPEGETSASYSEYREFTITVEDALRPLTGLKFKNDEKTFQLSHSYTLTDEIEYIPENPTYTGGITFSIERVTPSVGGVSKDKLTTYANPGDAKITAEAKKLGLKAEMTAHVRLVNPVQSITFANVDQAQGVDIEFDPYKMQYNTTSVIMKVEPEDADITRLSLVLDESDPEGKVTFMLNGTNPIEYDLVTTYLQNDGAYDLNAWGEGTATVHFESTDGTAVKSEPLTVRIHGRKYDNPDITDNFQDGTFWLNEEWFGHSNGSLNYLDSDRNMYYRVYNAANFNETAPRNDNSFGCTSQYGMIFGDRLYVMSKQEHDMGDSYLHGGGRLVIADAKTLKRLYSFDTLGDDGIGDGRACVGVSADKVYIGTHRAIRVLNIDNNASTPEEMFTLGKELIFGNVGGDTTPGSSTGSLYSNQIGDMICIGKYVFAVQQDHGILVIDTDTDEYVTTLGNKYAQAITQSADSNLWYALNDTDACVVSLHCVNPETLEETAFYNLPETAGTINTGWGAWRSANFFASREDNVLFWGNVGSGYQDDILGKGTGCIFRWKIGEDLPSEPFFFLGERPGKDENTFQSPYATMRYDDRNDVILMAATHGASFNYRYNWIYFINGTTGEIEECQELKKYFWFPSIPIFPDKHDPEITLQTISAPVIGEPVDIDLSEYLTDRDNIDRNIKVSLVDTPASVAEENALPSARYELTGKTLTVIPVSAGNHSVTLRAESNGKTVEKTIPVSLGTTTGLGDVAIARGTISVSGNNVTVNGYDGYTFEVYTVNGNLLTTFVSTAVSTTATIDAPAGVYILRATDGNDTFSSKLVLK